MYFERPQFWTRILTIRISLKYVLENEYKIED